MEHISGRHHYLTRYALDNGIKAYSNAKELTLSYNGVVHGTLKNGAYQIPDAEHKDKKGEVILVKGIPVDYVFFWKVPLTPGRNVVKVTDGAGHSDEMVIYQTPTDGPIVERDPNAIVQGLKSSNTENPAVFIDRAVEAQAPFYTDIAG